MKSNPDLFYPLKLSLSEEDKKILYESLPAKSNTIVIPFWENPTKIPAHLKKIDAFSKVLDLTNNRVGLSIFFQEDIQFHPHVDRCRESIETNYRLPFRINFYIEQKNQSVMHWFETPEGKEHYWTRDTTVAQSPWMITDNDYKYGEHPTWYKKGDPFESFPKSIWSVELNDIDSALVNTSLIHTVQQPLIGRRLTFSFFGKTMYWEEIVKVLYSNNLII